MHFFALISRMRDIRRWGLMRNTFDENVQEHSHMVSVIAHALALIRLHIFGRDCDPGEAAAAALYHDASEILTGDLPSPVKYHNPEIRDAYHKVEDIAREKLLEQLPEPLRSAMRTYVTPDEKSGVYELVHAADKLSAYIKCVEELRAGNTEFRSAGESIFQSLSLSGLPEVKYFMEHFIPSFKLSLDELN